MGLVLHCLSFIALLHNGFICTCMAVPECNTSDFKKSKKDCFTLESLHLSDMPNFGPIGQISGSLCCCVLDCFYVLYLYGFLTSYSIIWSYQSSHLHIIQTNNFLWGKCNGTTQHTYYLSNNNLWVKFSMYVDVSYMDYCCTIWVLFNCSTRAWYAHAQLYQNAM